MLLVAIVFFVVFVVVLLCVGLGLAFFETRQRSQIRQILLTAEPVSATPAAVLVRPSEEKDVFARWVVKLPFAGKLDLILQQSLLGWTPGRFLVMSVCGLACASFIGWQIGLLSSRPLSAAMLGAVGLVIPLLMVMRKRSKTLGAFEKQFPEALDFLSRSMRAGHGFSISLEMLASDSAEPLASALRRVSHEMQLGSSLDIALNKMVALVPLVDVRFFVSSVLLQQETGGNLGDILTKLAHVIRERFRLKGQVKALSAHGRITGLVLLLMPVVVVLLLLAGSPDYLATLTNDKDGRMMIYGAVAGQVLAYFCIKKIVNIKV